MVEFHAINFTNKVLLENIRNVHVHDFNKKGVDHFPIRTTSDNIQTIINSIKDLIKNKYEYNLENVIKEKVEIKSEFVEKIVNGVIEKIKELNEKANQ